MSNLAMNNQLRIECYCGYDVFVQRGWTQQNPGRRFVACPDYDAHANIRSCNFFRWVDKDMTEWQKEVILQLMEEKSTLQREVEGLKRKLELANEKVRKANTDKVMMKMVQPQRVWKFGLVINTAFGVIALSWLASYFM